MMRVSYDGGETWLDVPEAFVEEMLASDRDDVLVDVSGRGAKGQVKPWRLDELRARRRAWKETNR